jgi:hypothetical protein
MESAKRRKDDFEFSIELIFARGARIVGDR